MVNSHPFLRHEFLFALEKSGSVGRQTGWIPRYFLYRDVTNAILAAIPTYIKYNSYGELVFDWAWADAYQRIGLAYYPKLVAAIPYTPATSHRLLTQPEVDRTQVGKILIPVIRQYAVEQKFSSVHCLFPPEDELSQWGASGFVFRQACQFHWENRNYTSFEDYLSFFTARKRKMVRKERQRALNAGLDICWYRGDEADEGAWNSMYGFYCQTFEEKGGFATLTREFFREIAQTMGQQIHFVLALKGEEAVAGALFFHSDDTLYGRYWGCCEQFHSLHFELCYYQGLEFAIKQGLRFFEPGAQGEHKISRGFLPVATWSAHWLREPDLKQPVIDFIEREQRGMQQYMQELLTLSPFKTVD